VKILGGADFVARFSGAPAPQEKERGHKKKTTTASSKETRKRQERDSRKQILIGENGARGKKKTPPVNHMSVRGPMVEKDSAGDSRDPPFTVE